MKTGELSSCVRGHDVSKTSTPALKVMNDHQADMKKIYNKKTGNAWLRQNAYNMAVRMELRRRGLTPAPIKGTRRV